MLTILRSTRPCPTAVLVILSLLIGSIGRVHSFSVANPTKTLVSPAASVTEEQGQQQHSSLLDQWRVYDFLRDTDLEAEVVAPFFSTRPHLVAARLLKVSSTLLRTKRNWEETEDGNALCKSVASLGPVAVKVGQTLSQRPDIVGTEAAEALQRLQTKNVAYDNALAYAVMRESLNWSGPLAPGVDDETSGSNEKPLFVKMTKDPAACASLGQVYKATTWEGKEVAVKVQRPDAMAVLALDLQCFRLVFRARALLNTISENERNTETLDAVRGKQNVGTVIDRVGRDILDELDYTIEASNSLEFEESLGFLGFVTTPILVEKYCSKRVLVTEWVQGNHLEALGVTEGLAMTRMAVEACTASMVLTGLVHADPHEGNLMLHNDGRLVFLDFGLMTRVDQTIMEGFARGIQALLSEDWESLTDSFIDVGFVTEPIMHRTSTEDTWSVDPAFGRPQLAIELAEAMETTEGGKARFGALAEVLNKKISPKWLVFTPPYVLLLIRTFLTLEGIAAKLDPDFNIYEMAMPWAVRRSLSPSTQKGIEVFRSTILQPDNRIQWARLVELTSKNDDELSTENIEDKGDEIVAKRARTEAAKSAAMNDAVGSLLGSTEGKALRRALRDLDTADLLTRLSSADGRPLVEKAATVAANRAFSKSSAALEEEYPENRRPVSEVSSQLRRKQERWKKKITRFLIFSHLKRQLKWRGIVNLTRLSFRFARLSFVAVLRALTGFTKPPTPIEDLTTATS
jgi:predicted unusual protein kinase regulating ubiquinone biosynthesis (AarF/ABC1/UbiB family)